METRGCTRALSAARTFHSRRDIQVKQAFIPRVYASESQRIVLHVLIICVCLKESWRGAAVFISTALLSAAGDFVTLKIKLSEIEV